jgi:hypothetical protein
MTRSRAASAAEQPNVSDGDDASFGHAVFVSLVLRKCPSLAPSLGGGFHFTGLPIHMMKSGKTSASRFDTIHVCTSKRSIEWS